MNTTLEPEANKSGAFSYHTVLSALRCWWKIVVPISIVSAAAAGAVVLLLHKPLYTSEAWLMITPHREAVLVETKAESQKFIQNQIQIIRSPRLLRPLAADRAIMSTPELVRERIEPTLALARKLSVKPLGQSDMYAVAFTSESAGKSTIIVKAVIDAYLAHNYQKETEQGNRLLATLRDQLKFRRGEVEQLRESFKAKSKSLTGVDPFLPGNEERDDRSRSPNPLAGLQADIIRLQVEQDILAATIKAEEQRLSETSSQPTEKEIEQKIEQLAAYRGQKALILDIEEKEANFLKTGKNLATNPLFKQMQASLDKERASLERLKTSLHDEVRDALAAQSGAEATIRLKKLKEEHNLAAVKLGVLDGKFKDNVAVAKQVKGDTLELEFLKAKLQQVTAIHDAINSRILTITTEKAAPPRVELFQEASEPTQPDEIYPWKKVGMAAGLAFLFPLVLCVAWEHFFRRVSSREQLENIQQLSVVGEVTSLPTRSRQSPLGTRTAQRDVLLFEESVDSLRTYLSLRGSGRELRTIAVASAVSGEGKTSLAAQLAVCIARATREPTLLIDGDLRSPDIHNIFEIDVSPGLAEVLQDDCALEEAIDTSFSDRLHILTAGRLRTNPHRLLGSGDFQAMLERLKGTYQHIIIDTPPILPASESLVYARAADTAILCMRRDFSRLDQSQAAFARLQAAGVHVSGAVLNGIPTRQYAYHYGTYDIALNA